MSTPTMAPGSLTRTSDTTWTAERGRFTVERISGTPRGVPAHYAITDTARVDWIDRPGQGNVVRVFELDDARALIGRAVRNSPRRGRPSG